MSRSVLSLRVATYNVHAGVGADRRCDPERIVAVLAELEADVVGLQEVDARAGSGNGDDQFHYFAEATGLKAIAGPSLAEKEGRFGNVLLSRWPVLSYRIMDLSVANREPRSAIDAEIDVAGKPVRALVTHLGLHPRERRRQLRGVAKHVGPEPRIPTVVMGDFNVWGPERLALARRTGFKEPLFPPRSFPARFPLLALDRIWSLPEWHLAEVRAHDTPLARKASDHLPVSATLDLVPRLPTTA